MNWPVYLPFGSIRPIALAFDAPAHLIPDKGQFRPRFPLSAQLRLSDNLFLDPATDTDIISSATLLDGRAKRLARLLRCGRDRSGGGFPNAGMSRTASVMRRLSSEPAKKSGQNIPKNRCRTTVAERMMETLA